MKSIFMSSLESYRNKILDKSRPPQVRLSWVSSHSSEANLNWFVPAASRDQARTFLPDIRVGWLISSNTEQLLKTFRVMVSARRLLHACMKDNIWREQTETKHWPNTWRCLPFQLFWFHLVYHRQQSPLSTSNGPIITCNLSEAR